MDKISEKLDIISVAKDDIRYAIENKGVEVGDISISDYASKIDEITTGGGSDVKITNGNYLFYGEARTDYLSEILKLCKKLKSASNMFYGCTHITTINLSGIDWSECTTLYNWFYNCSSLKTLDLSNVNTSELLKDMSGAFNGCDYLTRLDFSSFNTSKIYRFSNLFYNCSRLTNLNLENCDASSCTVFGDTVFKYCKALTNLTFFNNLGKGYTQKSSNYSNYKIDLSYCTNLTHESLMDVINKLYDLNLTYDVANGGTLYTQQLVLGSANIAKLTSEDLEICTKKGWVVS